MSKKEIALNFIVSASEVSFKAAKINNEYIYSYDEHIEPLINNLKATGLFTFEEINALQITSILTAFEKRAFECK